MVLSLSILAATAGFVFAGQVGDFHGFASHSFTIDGCGAIVVEPKQALPGRPWIWRTMFWDAFPNFDIAMLQRGYAVAGIDAGNTYGSPDSLSHFDAFYAEMTGKQGLAAKPVLEGLSRGGLFAFRWGSLHPDKVSVIYADAPVCDMKMWPGGAGRVKRNDPEWQQALNSYHFTEEQMIAFKENPVDSLAPLAKHRVAVIEVCGDSDAVIPKEDHADIVRERYAKLHGNIVQIVKQGCDHHPHGLSDPTAVVNFVLTYSGGTHDAAVKKAAQKPGTIVTLPKGQW